MPNDRYGSHDAPPASSRAGTAVPRMPAPALLPHHSSPEHVDTFPWSAPADLVKMATAVLASAQQDGAAAHTPAPPPAPTAADDAPRHQDEKRHAGRGQSPVHRRDRYAAVSSSTLMQTAV